MWNVAQCSAQGTGHAKSGIPCQDKTCYLEKDGCVAIALADGAGSAKYSQFGAEMIIGVASEVLICEFDRYYETDDGREVRADLFNRLRASLSDLADRLRCEIQELASTLLTVVVKDERYILIHIGDGVLGYLQNDQLKVASYPDNGEFINTTVFTTSKEAAASMRLVRGEVGTKKAFVLISDGTAASLYDKQNKTLSDGIKKIMHRLAIEEPGHVQQQLQYSCETLLRSRTNDDCSIVVMVKNELYSCYNEMSLHEKCRRLNLHSISKKRIHKYDMILHFCKQRKSLSQISRYVHVKEKYLVTDMSFLGKWGLIVCDTTGYQSRSSL